MEFETFVNANFDIKNDVKIETCKVREIFDLNKQKMKKGLGIVRFYEYLKTLKNVKKDTKYIHGLSIKTINNNIEKNIDLTLKNNVNIVEKNIDLTLKNTDNIVEKNDKLSLNNIDNNSLIKIEMLKLELEKEKLESKEKMHKEKIELNKYIEANKQKNEKEKLESNERIEANKQKTEKEKLESKEKMHKEKLELDKIRIMNQHELNKKTLELQDKINNRFYLLNDDKRKMNIDYTYIGNKSIVYVKPEEIKERLEFFNYVETNNDNKIKECIDKINNISDTLLKSNIIINNFNNEVEVYKSKEYVDFTLSLIDSLNGSTDIFYNTITDLCTKNNVLNDEEGNIYKNYVNIHNFINECINDTNKNLFINVLNNNIEMIKYNMNQDKYNKSLIKIKNYDDICIDKLNNIPKIMNNMKDNIKYLHYKNKYEKIDNKEYINCFCCNERLLLKNAHKAHILSKKNGGSSNIENIRLTCQDCNLKCTTDNIYDFMFKNWKQ